MGKKCAIYNRYSTSNDKERLAKTTEILTRYCKDILKIDDFVVFEEISPVTERRKEFENMIIRIHKNEFTDLLVYDISRIEYHKEKFKNIVLDIYKYVDSIHSYKQDYDVKYII